jgi:NH3-dependent NAD+ synthetase
VFKVGAVLGVPESTLKAAPSADLWDGQEDEDVCRSNIGFVLAGGCGRYICGPEDNFDQLDLF